MLDFAESGISILKKSNFYLNNMNFETVFDFGKMNLPLHLPNKVIFLAEDRSHSLKLLELIVTTQNGSNF